MRFFLLPFSLTDRVFFMHSCLASSENDIKAEGRFLTWSGGWGWHASSNVGAGTSPQECLLWGFKVVIFILTT